MAFVTTDRFGVLEYEEGATIGFPLGLPGFDQYHRFVLVEQPPLAPLVFLQSLENPQLCFMALPLLEIDPEYQTVLAPEDLKILDGGDSGSILGLALLAATANGQLTANLLAPIILSLKTRLAVQAVRADRLYSHCHPLGEAISCS